MSVALTGATGFVGQAVLKRLLEDGYKVRAMTRGKSLSPHKNLEIFSADLTDKSALWRFCDGASVVIHCGGLVKSLHKDDMMRVNGWATDQLAKAAEASGVKRFLYVSSLAAREPDISIYAKSKFSGEEAVQTRSVRMGWDIIRPPAVYGAEDTQILTFFKLINKGVCPIIAPKEATVSLIYVEDLADAIHAWVASKMATADIYEVAGADDSGFSWEDILRTASVIMNKDPKFIRPPIFVFRCLARLSQIAGYISGRPPLLSPDKLNELRHYNWQVTDTQFSQKFGWAPKISMKQGVEKTINWYKSHNWL